MRRLRVTLVATLLAAVVLPAAGAQAFGGAGMLNARHGIGVSFRGYAFPRIFCAGGTIGFCRGTVTIRRLNGGLLGRAPIAIRSFDGPSVEVKLPAYRDVLLRHGNLPVELRVVTHDNAEPPAYKTVVQRTYLKRP